VLAASLGSDVASPAHRLVIARCGEVVGVPRHVTAAPGLDPNSGRGMGGHRNNDDQKRHRGLPLRPPFSVKIATASTALRAKTSVRLSRRQGHTSRRPSAHGAQAAHAETASGLNSVLLAAAGFAALPAIVGFAFGPEPAGLPRPFPPAGDLSALSVPVPTPKPGTPETTASQQAASLLQGRQHRSSGLPMGGVRVVLADGEE